MALKRNVHGAQFNQTPTLVGVAAADVADIRNLVVAYNTDGKVVVAEDATSWPVGIAIVEAGLNDITGENSGSVKAGDDVDILIKDIGYAIAGGAIKKGEPVCATAGGKVVKATSGYVLGHAVTDASGDGKYVQVQICKYKA